MNGKASIRASASIEGRDFAARQARRRASEPCRLKDRKMSGELVEAAVVAGGGGWHVGDPEPRRRAAAASDARRRCGDRRGDQGGVDEIGGGG